jgi:hypothetical protein
VKGAYFPSPFSSNLLHLKTPNRRIAVTAMATKALLKAVNEAIKQQKWDSAIESAGEVIQKDAKNYQA